jgi:transcriptional regulator with XRE-family HTH domain
VTGFGAALRRVREDVRPYLTQSRLAELAGFDHSYVSRLESGARTPTPEAVRFLAAALSLDGAGRDALLVAAGFLPDDVGSLLAGEPAIADLLTLLRDEALPGGYRDAMRSMLSLLIEQARLVRDGMNGGTA